jgi:hypothetical protein
MSSGAVPSFSSWCCSFLLSHSPSSPPITLADRTQRPEPSLSRDMLFRDVVVVVRRPLLSRDVLFRDVVVVVRRHSANCRGGRRGGIVDRRDNDILIEQRWRVVVARASVSSLTVPLADVVVVVTDDGDDGDCRRRGGNGMGGGGGRKGG